MRCTRSTPGRKTRFFHFYGLTASLILSVGAGVQPANASQESTGEADAKTADGVTLETVTVTGSTERSTDVHKSSDSISVIDGGVAEDLGIQNLRDTLRLMPNVNSSPANMGNNGIIVRGVNSEGVGEATGNRSLVAVTIDGASQSLEGIRRGARGMWDVESVEVHRGPQISLPGRNGLVGAMVVQTRKPTDYWEGSLKGGAGEDGLREGGYMLSGPLVPGMLAFRVAGESMRENHGISYREPLLSVLDEGRYHSSRAKLLLTPPALPGLAVSYAHSDVYDRPAVTAVDVTDPWSRRLSSFNNNEVREGRVGSNVLGADYTWAPDWRLKWRASWIDTRAIIGTPPYPAYSRDEIRNDKDQTQDVVLSYASPSLDADFGIFHGNFNYVRDSVVKVGAIYVQDLVSDMDVTNSAFYADVRWRPAPAWQLMAGARRDSERNETLTTFRQRSFYKPIFNDATGTRRDASSYKALHPKLGITYTINSAHNIGLTVTRGGRAGYYELTGFFGNGHEVEPEELLSYEIAYRGKWWDGKVATQLNLFRYGWRDMQIAVNSPVVVNGVNTTRTITWNADKAEIKGLELQAESRPARGFQLGGSVGLLSSRIKEFYLAATATDYSGARMPESPALSIGLWGIYRSGGLFASTDVTYKSEFYSTGDFAGNRTRIVDGYTLTNLRIGYESTYWAVVAHVDNVFDRQFILGRDTLGSAYVGDARRVGVVATLRF